MVIVAPFPPLGVYTAISLGGIGYKERNSMSGLICKDTNYKI